MNVTNSSMARPDGSSASATARQHVFQLPLLPKLFHSQSCGHKQLDMLSLLLGWLADAMAHSYCGTSYLGTDAAQTAGGMVRTVRSTRGNTGTRAGSNGAIGRLVSL